MSAAGNPFRVLFVCTGNICRSPSAEGVFRHMVEAEGLSHRIDSDSCGLQGWHVGNPPTTEAQNKAAMRGYDLSGLRARRLSAEDYDSFDLLLAMDDGHYAHLSAESLPDHRGEVRRFLEVTPEAGRSDVPDPYYGGAAEYEYALDLIEAGCRAWIAHIRARL